MAHLLYPTDYEELAGSPTFSVKRFGEMTAKRVLRLFDWDRMDEMIADLLPLQGRFGAEFPGKPFLKVDSIEIEPFWDDDRMSADEPPAYTAGAKFTISYKTPDFDADDVFFTHKLSIGGEFITHPSQNLVWANDLSRVAEDVHGGVISPLIEHSVDWKFIPFPPFKAIRRLLGKVNDRTFLNANQGCVLFLGAEAQQEIRFNGDRMWNLGYKFSEKNNGGTDTSLDPNSPILLDPLRPGRPKGWNFFLRPDGPSPGTFQALVRRDGNSLYDEEDFTPLFLPEI